MRGAVRAAVLEFTARFEGSLPFMYLDFHHKGDGTLDPLVTTGRGNLIDPLGAALRLPWRLRPLGPCHAGADRLRVACNQGHDGARPHGRGYLCECYDAQACAD